MPRKRKPVMGRPSLFRDKIRSLPVSFTASLRHHRKIQRAMKRLGLSRADVLSLLIERHADTVALPAAEPKPNTRRR
jgi:hypothetical protein